jgi:hypothetical protein
VRVDLCTMNEQTGTEWPGQGGGCNTCVQANRYTVSKHSGHEWAGQASHEVHRYSMSKQSGPTSHEVHRRRRLALHHHPHPVHRAWPLLPFPAQLQPFTP